MLGVLDKLFNRSDAKVTVSEYKMITDKGDGFFAYNGRLYESDIVRSAIRPKAQAIGKSIGKHIRDASESIKVNPDAYMRFLLEEPNEYMTGQMLQEKLTNQLALNNNAFALIQRDENGLPNAIYPLNSNSVEALKDGRGTLYLRFHMDGKYFTFKYSDIIHLRRDFNDNQIFGESPARVLSSLMEVIDTTDQGIVKAIKNSNIVKWLLKFNQTLRPEDLKSHTENFIDTYLSSESDITGAAATDAKFDAVQVDPKNYVPDAKQTGGAVERVYSFFNTNEKIVQSSYSEDDWISYYESEVEPFLIQMSNEYTRKLFTRRERGFGNRIIFEGSNLSFASMRTKLGLVQFVDRGILNPNEVRKILNLSPIDGGEQYLRRLDTATVKGGENDNED